MTDGISELAKITKEKMVHDREQQMDMMNITLQCCWLWPWLVIVVRPLCHTVRLVATSLTATWHLDVMPEQAALGEGGFLLTWCCRKHRRLNLSGSFGLVMWRCHVCRLVLPGSF
jgi:hypothetical protein